MTNEENRLLAVRLKATRYWRVMDGMTDDGTTRVVSVDGSRYLEAGKAESARSYHDTSTCVEAHRYRVDSFIPDLSDPATLGCLLALVRDAWRYRVTTSYVSHVAASGRDGWLSSASGTACRSEAEALVHALEAAPW